MFSKKVSKIFAMSPSWRLLMSATLIITGGSPSWANSQPTSRRSHPLMHSFLNCENFRKIKLELPPLVSMIRYSVIQEQALRMKIMMMNQRKISVRHWCKSKRASSSSLNSSFYPPCWMSHLLCLIISRKSIQSSSSVELFWSKILHSINFLNGLIWKLRSSFIEGMLSSLN